MTGFKIETLKIDKENEVSFCSTRGGIITSLKLKGKEILYFDEETFNNGGSGIRGGIPILFPNAGELKENNIYPNLKRHGFARDLKWESIVKADEFTETLLSDQSTKDLYPYDFKLSLSGKLEGNDSFSLVQEVENTEKEIDLPISAGLHPYFKVKDEDKKNIKFNFVGGNEIEEKFDTWVNGGTVVVDNPKVKDPNASVIISIPMLGDLLFDISTEYKKIWIWSMPNKDFICIEPMMRGLNGLIDDPLRVKPKQSFTLNIEIKLV